MKSSWQDSKPDIPRILSGLGLSVEIEDGSELTLYCPFHQEGNRPNLGFSTEKQVWHCWSCGAKGNLPGLVSRLLDVSYRDAVNYVVEHSGMLTIQELKEQNLRELDLILKQRETRIPVEVDISPYRVSSGWWSAIAKLDRDTISKFSLGFDIPAQRAIIPVACDGMWVGYVGRAVRPGQSPRYLYNRGFDRKYYLYAWDEVPRTSNKCIITEGCRDALRLHSYGIRTALACMGAGLTGQQVAKIQANFDEVDIFLDNDFSGYVHTVLAAETLMECIPYVYVVPYANQNKKDPDELTYHEVYKSLKNKIHWSYLC